MKNYAELTEQALIRFLEEAELEPLLRESMSYSLMNAGKRIRPFLCLLVSDMLSGKTEEALPFACTVEMIHTYSLIHDDLPAMDNDDMRRGKPSSHIAFGEANAVLAGDGLLSLAASILAGQDNISAASAVMEGAMAMLNGQIMDVNDLSKDDASLIRMYEGKTGGLFRSAILSGFYAAGGKKEEAEGWKKFANELGMLFQITDDILDREKDLSEGKFTYLTLHSAEETTNRCAALAHSLIDFIAPYRNEAANTLRQLILSLPQRKK